MTTHVVTAGCGERASAVPGMKELVQGFDWAATPLGARDAWPQSLRTTVDNMLASGHAMCVIWGPERILLYNDAYAPILGKRHPAALGRPAAAAWPELWDDIKPLVDRTFAGESCVFRDQPLLMTRKGYEEETWWNFAYSPVRDEQGNVAGLLNVTSDSTDRVLALQRYDAIAAEARDREAFMSGVLAASTDCIKVVELDGTVSFMSEGGMRTMEVSDFNQVRGCPWPDFLRADGPEFARQAIEAAKQGRTSHFETPADTYLGTGKFWSVSVSPIPGPDGRVARILSVSRDHTELEKAREQQRLVNGELAHRIKNTMSVVQAIVYQTLGKVADKASMKVFEERLGALSRSHDLLTNRSWSTAQIGDLTRAALATFGESRFEFAGPDVAVGSRATLSLSLMLHELATNAVKHGALSVPEGKVHLNWAVRRDGEAEVLDLNWAERGGPPAVEPTREGFGSRVIRMGLTGSGGVDVEYGTQGLTVRANATLHQVQNA